MCWWQFWTVLLEIRGEPDCLGSKDLLLAALRADPARIAGVAIIGFQYPPQDTSTLAGVGRSVAS